MNKLLATTLLLGALLALSACATMDTTTEAPDTQENDAPAI